MDRRKYPYNLIGRRIQQTGTPYGHTRQGTVINVAESGGLLTKWDDGKTTYVWQRLTVIPKPRKTGGRP